MDLFIVEIMVRILLFLRSLTWIQLRDIMLDWVEIFISWIVKQLYLIWGPTKHWEKMATQLFFFQHYWDTIVDSLFHYVNKVWANPSLISFTNNTLIVMIHKINKSELVPHFKPISLCNVFYKLISKVNVNIIKPLLNDIISTHQSSFILGWSIYRNIIIAHEMVRSMARMKDEKVFISIKIDLEKAYDRLNWNFIENCLEECNLPLKFIQVIHYCITSCTYKFMWNDEKTKPLILLPVLGKGIPFRHVILLFAW